MFGRDLIVPCRIGPRSTAQAKGVIDVHNFLCDFVHEAAAARGGSSRGADWRLWRIFTPSISTDALIQKSAATIMVARNNAETVAIINILRSMLKAGAPMSLCRQRPNVT